MKWLVAFLSVAVAIVAAVAAPAVFHARDRSAANRTMSSIRSIATAWESRATDFNTYAVGVKRPDWPAPADKFTWSHMHRLRSADLERALSPTYLKTFPHLDGWGTPFEFMTGDQNYAIRSLGSDRRADGDTYQSGAMSDLSRDFVYANGSFVTYIAGG
jgi:type II secretory pathway pseudopilin PulG